MGGWTLKADGQYGRHSHVGGMEGCAVSQVQHLRWLLSGSVDVGESLCCRQVSAWAVCKNARRRMGMQRGAGKIGEVGEEVVQNQSFSYRDNRQELWYLISTLFHGYP